MIILSEPSLNCSAFRFKLRYSFLIAGTQDAVASAAELEGEVVMLHEKGEEGKSLANAEDQTAGQAEVSECVRAAT